MPKADFFANIGGLNVTDSPFFVQDDQAIGGYNYDYSRTGAITKRRGHMKVNTSADTQTRTHGLGLHNTDEGVKIVIRTAGTKFQTLTVSSATFTDKSEDTAVANSTFFSSSSEQPVVFANFNTGNTNMIWAAGGGASKIYGYNGTNVTSNGAEPHTGTMTTNPTGSNGSFSATGTYYYAVALKKAGTDAVSNAALDVSAAVAATTQRVDLTIPAVSDQTKYDEIWIYRSAPGGVSGFTTGVLVAKIASNLTTYSDLGNVALDTTALVPRNGNADADHTVIPSGTYKSLVTWKRRLAAAQKSTIYISEFDQSEYFPLDSDVVIPSGGDIKALGIIGFNTPTSFNTDEKLIAWKDSEMWEVSGSGLFDTDFGFYDYTLKFVDKVGAVNQSMVVNAAGNVFWLNYRGIFMWNGSGKPIRLSRPIESLFANDGDIDKSRLHKGFGVYHAKENKIYWTVSDKINGENEITIKLDLRLTLAKTVSLQGDTYELDGVFIIDKWTTALYAGLSYLPSGDTDESYLTGDAEGFVYKMYLDTADPGDAGIEFSYETKNYDMGTPSLAKQFNKVIVWLDDLSVAKDLTLEYWADYRGGNEDKSQTKDNMDFPGQNSVALFDAGVFDVSYFDDFVVRTNSIEFNLKSTENNNQGDSIRLKFSQNDADAPVTIHGWSILWEPLSIRK